MKHRQKPSSTTQNSSQLATQTEDDDPEDARSTQSEDERLASPILRVPEALRGLSATPELLLPTPLPRIARTRTRDQFEGTEGEDDVFRGSGMVRRTRNNGTEEDEDIAQMSEGLVRRERNLKIGDDENIAQVLRVLAQRRVNRVIDDDGDVSQIPRNVQWSNQIEDEDVPQASELILPSPLPRIARRYQHDGINNADNSQPSQVCELALPTPLPKIVRRNHLPMDDVTQALEVPEPLPKLMQGTTMMTSTQSLQIPDPLPRLRFNNPSLAATQSPVKEVPCTMMSAGVENTLMNATEESDWYDKYYEPDPDFYHYYPEKEDDAPPPPSSPKRVVASSKSSARESFREANVISKINATTKRPPPKEVTIEADHGFEDDSEDDDYGRMFLKKTTHRDLAAVAANASKPPQVHRKAPMKKTANSKKKKQVEEPFKQKKLVFVSKKPTEVPWISRTRPQAKTSLSIYLNGKSSSSSSAAISSVSQVDPFYM